MPRSMLNTPPNASVPVLWGTGVATNTSVVLVTRQTHYATACCTPGRVIPVSHSSERTFPVRAILRVPFFANGWDPREAQHSWALLTLWRVPSYSQCSQAPSRSREKVRTSLHEWQRGGRRSRRGQSHSEELPLRGRRWPPMACRSPQTSSVLLWCAWRPSSSSSSRRGSATVTVIGLGS